MARLDPEDIGLHSIRPKPGSRHPRKRLGRGKGSGTGKTAGRGHKGAGARAGAKDKRDYEGGQNPIHMRMRKLRGPNKKMSMPFEQFRTHTQPVNLSDLEAALRRRRRGHPGDAARRRPGEARAPGQGARPRRALEEADRPRARVQRHGEGEDRGRGRHLRSYRVAQCSRRSPTPSRSRRSAGRSSSRWRCWRSTGSGPTSRRRGSTSTRVDSIEGNFTGNNVLGFLNLFSGGSLQRLSLFALGIMPYITASIILQLLTVVVPALERLQKEGEVGQQKITQYTRYLTVGLAFGQSIGYVFLFQSFQDSCRPERRRRPHLRQGVPDRDLADRGHGAADVARRADHPARRRQRDQPDDLRLDRLADLPGARASGGTTPTRSSS